jgi:hypothetical protein
MGYNDANKMIPEIPMHRCQRPKQVIEKSVKACRRCEVVDQRHEDGVQDGRPAGVQRNAP